jgi:hypothetical protein
MEGGSAPNLRKIDFARLPWVRRPQQRGLFFLSWRVVAGQPFDISAIYVKNVK